MSVYPFMHIRGLADVVTTILQFENVEDDFVSHDIDYAQRVANPKPVRTVGLRDGLASCRI